MNGRLKSIIIFVVASIAIIIFVENSSFLDGIDKYAEPPQNTSVTVATPVKATEKPKERTTPISGENARITEEMPVAVSKEALDEMINYINANNKEALTRMALRGDFFKVNKNERITVVDSGFLSSEIEVIATGRRGFVPNEFLVKE